MAAVVSETITETLHFAKMRRGDEHQRSPASPQYSQSSRPRSYVPPSPRPQPTHSIPQQTPIIAQEPLPNSRGPNIRPSLDTRQSFASQQYFTHPSQGSSSNPHFQAGYPSEDALHPHSEPQIALHLVSPAPSANSPIARPVWLSDDLTRYGGNTIKVRDLAHIQSFANETFLSYRGKSERRRAEGDPPWKYEISSMPITDIIEMVAGLLTKITTTNDRQHENLHRPIPTAESAANLPGLTSSVLAFHGKNVPSITILSYLSRIHKYCPTTYEVFLSLLVYFDRMTERVNAVPLQDLRRGSPVRNTSRPSTASATSEEMEIASDPDIPGNADELARESYATPPDDDQISYNLSHFFVVDSFNIHRLVIAGVTCASKFFSDVF
jgi:PHO85 cyclin-6/7